jgi:hypothetical protein
VDQSLAVRAVNIISVKEEEGDVVRVQVSVFLGAKFHDKEEHVATFRLREAQSIRVDELTRFGVEPIEITLIRPPVLLPNPPEVINKADSIEVVGIEANNSTLPSYRLSLRNRSSKNLVALQIDVHVGDEKRLISQPMGKEGHPLIKAGAIFQTNVPGVKQATMTRQGYMPDSPQGQTILIGTAVFDDGTFEGDPRMAAHIRARVMGQKIQLTDVLSLLDNTVESSGADTSTLGRLRQQASSLKEDVEMTVVDELLRGISNVESSERSALRVSFQVTLHSIKKQLLDAIDRFEKDQNASPDKNNFKTWLNTTREQYKQWLSRL